MEKALRDLAILFVSMENLQPYKTTDSIQGNWGNDV